MTFVLYLFTAAALLILTHACVTRLTRGAALALILLPLVFTGRALLTGRVYAPVELAYTTDPLYDYAAEVGAPGPRNRMLSDITFPRSSLPPSVSRNVAGPQGLRTASSRAPA